MSVRSLIIVGTLALSSVALAKSYDITVTATVKAGDAELKPGQYKLKIENGQAVFTDSHDKSVSVPAKVENAEKRFNGTRLETASHDGIDTILAIDLGDSNTRVKLGQ
jgi:hypothetical protein